MSPATIAMIVQIVPDYQAKRPIFLAIHNSVINQHRELIYNSGKFFFTSFWASFRRRILCRLDWPVTGYTGQENIKFLFHSLQHLENWDCRHVPSWFCLVETMVLCILGIQSINWVSVVEHLPPNWSLNSRRESEFHKTHEKSQIHMSWEDEICEIQEDLSLGK